MEILFGSVVLGPHLVGDAGPKTESKDAPALFVILV
jgi:hypothetical protein